MFNPLELFKFKALKFYSNWSSGILQNMRLDYPVLLENVDQFYLGNDLAFFLVKFHIFSYNFLYLESLDCFENWTTDAFFMKNILFNFLSFFTLNNELFFFLGSAVSLIVTIFAFFFFISKLF
jgi:hypothetical protein